MGGSGSTRRVTVQEDDAPGMVKISESVVSRLVGKDNGTISKSGPRYDPYGSGDASSISRNDTDIIRLEKYYDNKIVLLENRNKELFDEQKEQFAHAVEEVEKKFLKTTSSPICQELQNNVLTCYRSNPHHPLLCSAQVQAFNQCIQEQREKILTKKG